MLDKKSGRVMEYISLFILVIICYLAIILTLPYFNNPKIEDISHSILPTLMIIYIIIILKCEKKFENFRKNYIIFLIPIISTLFLWFFIANYEGSPAEISAKIFLFSGLYFYFFVFLCSPMLLFWILSFPRVFHGVIWLTCRIIDFCYYKYKTIRSWYCKLQLRKGKKSQLEKGKDKITICISSITTENKKSVFRYFVFELCLFYFVILSLYLNYSPYETEIGNIEEYIASLWGVFLISLIFLSPLFCLYFAGFQSKSKLIGPPIYHKLFSFSALLVFVWYLANEKFNFEFFYFNIFNFIEILWMALGFSLEIDNTTAKIHKHLESNISKYKGFLEIKYERDN